MEEEHVAGLADELHRLDRALDVLHHGLVALRRVEAASLLRLEAIVEELWRARPDALVTTGAAMRQQETQVAGEQRGVRSPSRRTWAARPS